LIFGKGAILGRQLRQGLGMLTVPRVIGMVTMICRIVAGVCAVSMVVSFVLVVVGRRRFILRSVGLGGRLLVRAARQHHANGQDDRK
jgi:hypothetical protein